MHRMPLQMTFSFSFLFFFYYLVFKRIYHDTFSQNLCTLMSYHNKLVHHVLSCPFLGEPQSHFSPGYISLCYVCSSGGCFLLISHTQASSWFHFRDPEKIMLEIIDQGMNHIGPSRQSL